MADIGTVVKVAQTAPETAKYRHSACGKEIVLNKDNRVPPCPNRECPKRGAHWSLSEKL